jgi:hypothetical protein
VYVFQLLAPDPIDLKLEVATSKFRNSPVTNRS